MPYSWPAYVNSGHLRLQRAPLHQVKLVKPTYTEEYLQGFVLLTPYQLWVRLGLVQDHQRWSTWWENGIWTVSTFTCDDDLNGKRWSTFMVLNKAQVEPKAGKGSTKWSPEIEVWTYDTKDNNWNWKWFYKIFGRHVLGNVLINISSSNIFLSMFLLARCHEDCQAESTKAKKNILFFL